MDVTAGHVDEQFLADKENQLTKLTGKINQILTLTST